MALDLDIWRATAMHIQRHGAPDAALVVAQRADGNARVVSDRKKRSFLGSI
jgi:hypothetical protein